MFAGIPVTRRMGLVGFARAVSSLVPLSWHQMRNRMRSQPGEGRQCVRHARYRQYQPDSFLFPLSGASGDKTPDHPVAIGCIVLLLSTRVPSSPDTTPVFITTSTQPLLFLFLPPVRVEQPSMNRHWDCIGVFCLDCAHRVWIFFLFFLLSFCFFQFLDLSLFASLFVFFLDVWRRYPLRGMSSIMFYGFIVIWFLNTIFD